MVQPTLVPQTLRLTQNLVRWAVITSAAIVGVLACSSTASAQNNGNTGGLSQSQIQNLINSFNQGQGGSGSGLGSGSGSGSGLGSGGSGTQSGSGGSLFNSGSGSSNFGSSSGSSGSSGSRGGTSSGQSGGSSSMGGSNRSGGSGNSMFGNSGFGQNQMNQNANNGFIGANGQDGFIGRSAQGQANGQQGQRGRQGRGAGGGNRTLDQGFMNQLNQQGGGGMQAQTPQIRPRLKAAFDFPEASAAPVVASSRIRFDKLTARYPQLSQVNVAEGERGVVVLTGEVGSRDTAKMAESLLRLEPGVRGVQNNLTYPAPAAE